MKKLLLIPVIILFLAIISAVIFIGGGYLISLVIPLTLFQASILCIGATFVSVFIITIILAGMAFAEYRERGYDYGEYDYEDDEEEEDDDEDVEEDETDNTTKRKIIDIKTVKTGRNEPCPCGSGKKYKRCCGK